MSEINIIQQSITMKCNVFPHKLYFRFSVAKVFSSLLVNISLFSLYLIFYFSFSPLFPFLSLSLSHSIRSHIFIRLFSQRLAELICIHVYYSPIKHTFTHTQTHARSLSVSIFFLHFLYSTSASPRPLFYLHNFHIISLDFLFLSSQPDIQFPLFLFSLVSFSASTTLMSFSFPFLFQVSLKTATRVSRSTLSLTKTI